jgi:parallel beta-helix repeat protein
MKQNKLYLIFISISLIILSFFACQKDEQVIRTAPPKPTVTTPKIYYVAVVGDDARSPEQAKDPNTPWRTIQHAADMVSGGSTVIISAGTYSSVILPKTCSGSTANPTIFRNKLGETPVIEGKNSGVIWDGLFNLNGTENIILKGIKVQNGFWYGFRVENAKNITIDSCLTFNTQASGIYARNSSSITITNNNVRKACQRPYREPNGNGTQECITITGVKQFKINQNEVWDSIISDAAGGEGIDAKGGSADGEIVNNYVHDIEPLGIYVDAGSGESYNIRIFGNTLNKTAGVAVAGELGGSAHEIYFYNNIVRDSRKSGFVFQSTGNGKYTNIFVVNNTFYNNAREGFAGDIGNYSKNTNNSELVIKNNIFYNKVSNSRFSIWHDIAAPHIISHNLYFDFKPSNNNNNSFKVENLTINDIRKDPEFNLNIPLDFSLKGSSPAINKGIPITLPNSTTLLFTKDFNGKDRGTNDWDMGAFEF